VNVVNGIVTSAIKHVFLFWKTRDRANRVICVVYHTHGIATYKQVLKCCVQVEFLAADAEVWV
jgi:phage tail protein X